MRVKPMFIVFGVTAALLFFSVGVSAQKKPYKPCGISLTSLSKSSGVPGDVFKMIGTWGPVRGTKIPCINKGGVNKLIVLSWSNSVIKVKIPPGLAPGLYKVGVYCNGLSVGGSSTSGWKDFKIRKSPSKANDIDVSDIWLDDKCRLWVKHTNRGTTRLNIVLRERIWVNGRMIDDSTETIVLAPGTWTSHGVLADPGYIVSGGVEVKAQIDVDNVLVESNERNNILKKRVRCKKPPVANDIDVSDIWLDDKCRLWIKHTNHGTTNLNIILRERIWVNGRMIDDSTETIVLAPGRWTSHGVLADPGYIVSGGVEVKAQIDVDNVLAESNERNNILKKRVRCKKLIRKIAPTKIKTIKRVK